MTEQIKTRLAAIQHSEIPQGYCRINGYIVPAEWEQSTCLFGDVFKRLQRKNTVGNTNVLTISAQQGLISQQSFFKQEVASEDKSGYFLLNKGDFAYNKSYSTGYPLGATKRLEFYESGILSPLYICFETKANAQSDFYVQYFDAGMHNREIYKIAQEGARNHGLLNIAIDDYFGSVLVVPPLPEQQKIAEILTTCDKVITLKKKRLAQKQKQKKWLMKNLLSHDSGVRLPGFDGEWEEFIISDIAQVLSGGTPSTSISKYWNGSIFWCTPSDISAVGKYINSTPQRITETGQKNSGATLLPVGTIIMCSRATIGTRAITLVPMTTNQGFKNFVCGEKLHNEYFYYYIDAIMSDFLSLAAGNTFKEISKSSIEKCAVSLPSLPEQTAIATVLSAADREINLLTQELAAWEQKKKSLMQLLLTGIARVNICQN